MLRPARYRLNLLAPVDAPYIIMHISMYCPTTAPPLGIYRAIVGTTEC